MGKVLITGGAGFIGSHLCDRLLTAGNEVICVDNFLSGSRDSIAHLLNNPQFTLIEQDVCLPLESKISSLSSIFHFASPASPNPDSPVSYINHPVETLMVNSVGTARMLDLAVENGCPIILASTSEVYGDPAVHPQPETYWGNVSPNGVRSCYDEGKRFLEAVAFAYHRSNGVKIKVIRIFNTYGPRMRLDDGRFIPTLVDCLVHSKPFVRFGTGSATRSFCYIDDLLEGIMKVYETDSAVGQVINLGNPTELTVNEAIKIAEGVSGVKLEVIEQAALLDDPQRRQPDITKAREILDWQPSVTLQEGLSRMIRHYQ